jgi:hypothetical protein
MNSALEFHDSECLAIEFDSGGNVVVTLDAYVHRTEGEPGHSPGDGGMQRVRISIESTAKPGEIGTLPASIYDGSLLTASNSCPVLVPLPFQLAEPCELTLELFDDDARTIQITGNNVSVTPEGEFRFVEHVDFSAES